MRVRLVILGLPPRTPQPRANRFVQKFYGQDAITRSGRYRYRKAGLLDGLPHRKLRRGVVVLRERDWPKVEAFLRDWGADFEVRVIKPTPEDLSALAEPAH